MPQVTQVAEYMEYIDI